jgi:fructose-1,6-bisphosphatase/sedoheptulose 1,7-bisphosphatase-like protein
LSKFTQLDAKFDIQENNWRRWAGGKAYLNHLYWNGCMTGRLQESAIQLSESASDSLDEIAKLDAYEFNKIVQWLPDMYRKVYLAYVFNKAVLGGKVRTTRAGDVNHQCSLLGLTKYRYDQLLDRAIGMIKREGGLA